MPYPEKLPLHVIWDEIAYLLDFTRDLLSLALTCHTFKELVIPNHLEYRYINCDIRRKDIWQLLNSRPRLAKGIRSLRLRAEPSALDKPQLPRILDESPDRNFYYGVPVADEHVALFRNSLSYMTLLKELVWKHNHVPAGEVINIFRVLTSTSHSLKALSINFFSLDNPRFSGSRQQLENFGIWNLTCLTKVVIVHAPGPATIQMLIHCPDIEDLSLWSLPSSFSPQLFVHATWKKLRRLHITTSLLFNAYSQDISGMLISFFERHVGLESLFFAMLDLPVPLLPSSCLPKLRSIAWEANVAYPLTDFLSQAITAHLVHWQCPIDEIDLDRLPQMDQLESCHLSVYGYLPRSLAEFLGHAPNLKKFSIHLEDPEVEDNVARKTLLEAFHQCSKLTHAFSSIPLMTKDDTSLVSILPKLQFTEVETDGENKYVELERSEEGKYLGYHCVTLEKAGGSPETWGNFFLHL